MFKFTLKKFNFNNLKTKLTAKLNWTAHNLMKCAMNF